MRDPYDLNLEEIEAKPFATKDEALAYAQEVLPQLIAEVRLLRQIRDRTYCAFCGWDIGVDEPGAADKVYDHILTCEKHPLGRRVRELEAELANVTEQRNHYMTQMGRWVVAHGVKR
jgi:hypothetical protein